MRMLFLALLAAAALTSNAQAQCSSFQPAYPGLNNAVLAFIQWDPDGPGPESSRLVAGGAFTDNGQGSQDYIAYWDGAAWRGLGWGTDGPVLALAVWDPDGPGPTPPQLIIGGGFTHVGADSTGQLDANHIARWDGAAWRPMAGGTDGPISALAVWDPDGPGDLPAVLIAAGSFRHADGLSVDYIASWDGVSWGGLGWGVDGPVQALTTWDPDGAGLLGTQLVAAGQFTHAGAGSTGEVGPCSIARWNGSDWTPMGGTPTVYALATYRPQGAGPTPSKLVAGGAWGVSQWSAGTWVPMGSPHSYTAEGWCCGPGPTDSYTVSGSAPIVTHALLAADPDGDGPLPPTLYAHGVASISAWCGSSTYDGCPHSWSWNVGELSWFNGVGFTVASIGGSDAMCAFSPNGAGAPPFLFVAGGEYPNVVALCSSNPYCGSADFDHDGDTGTDADIESFFACIAGSCCPTCGGPDFNGDGDERTDADIESFFRVLAGGPC